METCGANLCSQGGKGSWQLAFPPLETWVPLDLPQTRYSQNAWPAAGLLRRRCATLAGPSSGPEALTLSSLQGCLSASIGGEDRCKDVGTGARKVGNQRHVTEAIVSELHNIKILDASTKARKHSRAKHTRKVEWQHEALHAAGHSGSAPC